MVNVASSRSTEKPRPVASPKTIKFLVETIAADEDIPEKRRADVCSGVRSLCRALGLQPESTPADPRLIAERLENITPAAAGMKKGRLQNCVCHMDAAFAYADARFRRRRNQAPLDPRYVAPLGLTPDRWVAARLRPAFHFATMKNIAPASIDDKFFDDFTDQLRLSTVNKARASVRNIRKDWNEMVDSVRVWPGRKVEIPTYVDHYVLPAGAFPESLWVDVDGYLETRRSKGAADLDDLLTEEELFDDGVADAGRHVRDSTAALVRYRVRQFASALVHLGVMPATEMVALKTLVAPKTVNDGLKFFIQRAGKRENSQIRGIASDLLAIAKRWVRSPESELAKLGSIVKKVRPKHQGLPESARRSLAPFRDPAKVRAFLTLPDEIMKEAEREKTIDRTIANRVAATLWMRITQRAPLRISNLLSTDLTKNILRSHNGKDAAVALYYTPDQVKNEKTIEVPLSRATVKLLDLYLDKYRNLLIDAPFPASNGRAKLLGVISADVQRLMREYIGFAINPHSFRHVAAKLYLTAHPGRYVDVQRLLGHRNLETTVKYYTEIEAEEVFKHFDAVLLGLEDATNGTGSKK
jgi:integrase